MALKYQEYTWKIHNFSTNIVQYMKGSKYLRTPTFDICLSKIRTEWSLFLNFNCNGIDLFCHKNYYSGSDDIKVKFDIQIPTSSNNFIVKRSEEKSLTELENGFKWSQLISSVMINKEMFQSLENDTLIINFKIELIREKKEHVKIKPLFNNDGLMAIINECYDTKAFADFIFICSDGENIPAHRLICSANSQVMRAMFTTEMREAKDCVVKVPDIDGKTMTEVLRFIYTKSVCCLDILATKLLYAAEKYGLDELKQICLARMIESLSIENALEYFFLADRYNNSDLLVTSIAFIKLNYKILREVAKDWNNLNSKQWAMLLDHFNEEAFKFIHVFDSSM